MTAASMLPDKPPDRIDHDWRCTRRRIAEVVRRDANGQARIVRKCLDCHREEGDDTDLGGDAA